MKLESIFWMVVAIVCIAAFCALNGINSVSSGLLTGGIIAWVFGIQTR